MPVTQHECLSLFHYNLLPVLFTDVWGLNSCRIWLDILIEVYIEATCGEHRVSTDFIERHLECWPTSGLCTFFVLLHSSMGYKCERKWIFHSRIWRQSDVEFPHWFPLPTYTAALNLGACSEDINMVRRRRRRQSVVCLFCALCCILFVLANLLLIHGFSLHDVTAFVEDTPKASVPLHGPPSLQRELLPPAKSLYLPIAAINFENKIRKLMDSDDYQSYEQTFKQWNTSSSNDLIHITASDLRRILTSTSECKNVNQLNLTRQTFLASGWTKAVYRGQLDDKKVAIKTVDAEGHDVSMCQQHYLLSEQQCYSRAAHKVLKEMVLLRGLQHPHVVEVRTISAAVLTEAIPW